MAGPSIVVEDMTEAEFDAYYARLVPAYAEEGARAMGLALDEALVEARRQLGALLPDGRATKGHAFKTVRLSSGEPAGTLWFAHESDPRLPSLFLYDIVVEEAMRGRGLGTALMRWLEAEGRRRGAADLGLSVFDHNRGAVGLYEKLGFRVAQKGTGGMRMVKDLEAQK